uniref:protein kinase domain-containing protein n=1 Tax=Thermonema rossianum TaxID=55505 RepID=UPI00057134A9
MQLFTSNGTPVQLGEMLGSGGEGIVYEVNNHPTRTSLVAKVFFSPEKAAQKEAKLRYMIQNPPEIIEQDGHTFLAWPMDLLFNEQGQFTGFLMPKAEGVELEYLCSQDFEHYPEFQEHAWRKFYFSHPMVAYYRLRTAFNICAAVHALHQKGYVIGDLKPVNIFVLPNGLISIADLDSIQIHTKEGHFPSMAVTPEYAPPE